MMSAVMLILVLSFVLLSILALSFKIQLFKKWSITFKTTLRKMQECFTLNLILFYVAEYLT
jgi:hypothetical protein